MSAEQRQLLQERKAATSKEMAQTINLTELADDLQPCAAQWELLGTMLNMSQAALQGIKGESERVRKCFVGVLMKWLQTKCSPNTKEQLLKVLRKNAMGPEEALAKEIEENGEIPAELTQKHLPILLKSLDGIASKYQSFAIQLGVSHDAVKNLEAEHRVQNVKQYLEDMLALWLKQGKPFSELVEAVRNPPIHNEVLARELEEKYNMNPTTPPSTHGADTTTDRADSGSFSGGGIKADDDENQDDPGSQTQLQIRGHSVTSTAKPSWYQRNRTILRNIGITAIIISAIFIIIGIILAVVLSSVL